MVSLDKEMRQVEVFAEHSILLLKLAYAERLNKLNNLLAEVGQKACAINCTNLR